MILNTIGRKIIIVYVQPDKNGVATLCEIERSYIPQLTLSYRMEFTSSGKSIKPEGLAKLLVKVQEEKENG